MELSNELWKYGTLVYECSNLKTHAPDCKGCDEIEISNLKVDLHNEAVEWANRGMMITGVPRSLELQGMPLNGITVEIFEVEMRLSGLIHYLADLIPNFDMDKASEKYQEVMLKKLRAIREQQDKANPIELAVAKTRLFGPNGEPLH